LLRRTVLFSNIHYIVLRVLRRFVFRGRLLSVFERNLPYYRTNFNEISPSTVAEKYSKYCSVVDMSPRGKNVLEIGIGVTNSCGYEIVAQGARRCWGYEPFEKFNAERDRARLDDAVQRHVRDYDFFRHRFTRIDTLADLEEGSIELVLSHNVLEHVTALSELVDELERLLTRDGCMIHIVDYRDHFFEYPYHFLQFSDKTWNRFLNPGHLPRYRLDDHVEAFRSKGFSVEILETSTDNGEFAKVRERISQKFKEYSERSLAVTTAVLAVSRSKNRRIPEYPGCDF